MSATGSRQPGVDPQRIADLFAEAIEHPAEQRQAFLDSACSGSAGLRAEVDSLLAAHERAGEFLERLNAEQGTALLGTAAPEMATRRVGPYRLLRELGRGGMGVVYLAERAEGGFEQRVAVKLIKRGMDTDAILQRFLRERQILASLEHTNVARLLDGGVSEDGQPYFAMEYVDGEPLTGYCDSQGLEIEERLRLFEEAARAVQYAHGRLVVHRDLKPSNMLVTRQGQLKLLDFGVAKLLGEAGEAGATELSQLGARPLTPHYAAPEQVRGEPVTTATDVYALGVVLYELLTGRRPYGGEGWSSEALARAVCEQEPDPPSAAVPDRPRLARRLRGDLDAIVLRALSKEPKRRYASAEALAEDVRRHLAGQPVQARPDSVRYRAAKFVRRHRVGVAAAAAAVLSLLVGLLGTAWQARVAARERDRARSETERAEKVKQFLVGIFKASDPAESKGEAVTARELLDRGTERIEKELADHPALQAELLEIVSGISLSLGRFDRARSLGERSLGLARQVYGPEHFQVARALETLAETLRVSGDYAASEDLHRQALAMHRRLLPADSPDLATSLNRLSLVLRVRAKLEEAEILHRESLAIRERNLGPEHPDTLSSVLTLAELLLAKGDYSGAVEQDRKVLRIRRKALGDLDPEVAVALSHLGGALSQDGDQLGAEAAHREALSIRRRVYGEEHPLVSESLGHLAAALHSKGDLENAETIYRQALALDRKLKGEEHRDVAVGLANLAYDLAQQGRFEEAMPLFERAVSLHRRVTGADHPLLARALERRAAALTDQGRPREALPLLDECLSIDRARYGDEHPRVATALAASARAKAEIGELAEAETVFRAALDVQRRVRPKAHITTAEALAGLGEVLTRLGRASEAEPLLREALSQAEQSLSPGHWRQGEVQSVLGACLWQVGRPEEARSLLAAGYQRLRDARGEEHPATRRARRRLDAARG